MAWWRPLLLKPKRRRRQRGWSRGVLQRKEREGVLGEGALTALALAEKQQLHDLPLLAQGALSLDVFVYLVADPTRLCLLREPLHLLLRGLVDGRAQRSVEGVWRLSGRHGWSLVGVVMGERKQDHEASGR